MKHVVVTGSSRGIGLELVKQLANAGHQVLALSRNTNPVCKLGLENAKAISYDLSDNEVAEKCLHFIRNTWSSKVDVVIHNAGKLVNKPFEELSLTDFQEVYGVNVFGVAQLTQQLLPFLGSGSHVVAISSMGGVQGSMKFPGLAAYSSAKAAVITLMELLAEEYKDTGIAFNSLALGAVQTEMLEEAFPGYIAPLNAIEMASYIVNFALTGNKFYNGKLLQVSISTP